MFNIYQTLALNTTKYSSDKMGSGSKPFDIYEVPDSDFEKPKATKGNLQSTRTTRSTISTPMKTKTHGKRGFEQVEERTNFTHKTRPKREPKQSELEKKWKGGELAMLRRSARLKNKENKTS